jgi:RNA polymerase sigma-70 factor, ECF subfamily
VGEEAAMTADLIEAARAGDGQAFGQLVEPYRRELQVHCYQILGSVADAEDALQDTLLSAWQGLAGFEGRASIRTWLYRVATSRCLDALRSASRRPPMNAPPAGFEPPEPTRLGQVLWLEPYPDVLLDRLPDSGPGPEARYQAKGAISLAFITALQLLPPRQRAALILRDVLGFHAKEAAQILDTSEESVTSALKRARATLHRQQLPSAGREPPPPPGSALERELVQQLTEAFETADVNGIVALLTDDIWLTMPPLPLEYQGRERGRSLGLERGHRTLTITRKGGKVVTIPLAPRTGRAIDLAIGGRTDGPVFLTADGRRLDRHGAGRIVRKVARRAPIAKTVTPHTLRHAFITAVDAGVRCGTCNRRRRMLIREQCRQPGRGTRGPSQNARRIGHVTVQPGGRVRADCPSVASWRPSSQVSPGGSA